MCRWLAYEGPPLELKELLFEPENSLIRQSLAASKSIVPTNGDGFGVGWYSGQPQPGLFRDTMPAWNDANLQSLSEQIRSELFFAHVRASTGTSTSRENCHPFRSGRLLFMHNGQIGGYRSLRRELEQLIPDDIYPLRRGTTDTEALFLIACGHDLESDVESAMRQTITRVLSMRATLGTDDPFRMTAAIADGERLYAVRYSSDQASPSLYYATGGAIQVEDGQVKFDEGKGATLVLSEPLDDQLDGWTEIPEGHILEADGSKVEVRPFEV